MDPQKTLSNELHRQKRKRYPTRSVVTDFPYDLIQADLVEMHSLLPWNKGYPYLLTMVDSFSKRGFARPLKNKTGKEVTAAFTDVLKEIGKPVKNLQTDQGKEFYNREFQRLVKDQNIMHYHTYTDKKASIVERFNRSLKMLMWKKFTQMNNFKWVKILPNILKEYNNRHHRTIKMSPNQVSQKNIHQVKQNILDSQKRKKSAGVRKPFHDGDIVRISRVKNVFDKEASKPNWSEELFKIVNVQKTKPVTYDLQDLLGEDIKGSFYHQELQKTSIPDYSRIEKVIARKKAADGTPLIRVKWQGYSNRFNQWIPLSKTKKL